MTADRRGVEVAPAARALYVLRNAQRLLDLCDGRHPAAYHAVAAGYGELSDELYGAAEQFGFDDEHAWRLLGLRESLDSHLLAADALAQPGLAPSASLALLRRGVERLVERLPGTVPAGDGSGA